MFNYNHIGKKELEVKNLINNKVYISLLAFKKMTTYIKECSKEIGWLGTVEEVPGGYLIKDTFLFKQQVHSTTCEITPQGLSDFIMGLYDTYDTDTAMNISNSIMLWGHSHVNMGVFPSAQDVKQLESFKDSEFPYFLGVIGNKRGEFNFTLNHYQSGVIIKDLDWELYLPELNDESLDKEIKAEIKEKVEDLPVVPINSTLDKYLLLDNKPLVGSINNEIISVENTKKEDLSQIVMTSYRKESLWLDSLSYKLTSNINKTKKSKIEKNTAIENIKSHIDNLKVVIEHYDLEELINYAKAITPDNKDKIAAQIEARYMEPFLDFWGEEYEEYDAQFYDDVVDLTTLTLNGIEFLRKNMQVVKSM